MTASPLTTELLKRLRGGDREAAGRLFELYSQKLTALAERNISHRLAGRVGGEDIVQSVFRTFFRRNTEGELRIDNSMGIWRLLVKITLAKVRSQARHHRAGKRDVRAETPGGLDDWMFEAIADEPTAEEAAILLEQIETILDGLPQMHGQILALRLEGHARTEIARQLGVSRQTVYRVLTLLQQRLEGTLPDHS